MNKITVLRLLADAGQLAMDYHDVMVRHLKTRRVQCDEIWQFVGCKQKNVRADLRFRHRRRVDGNYKPAKKKLL